MKYTRIVMHIPDWHNGLSFGQLHETRLLETLSRTMFKSLEEYGVKTSQRAVAKVGESNLGLSPCDFVLSLQVRQSKKPMAWQTGAILAGAQMDSAARKMIECLNRWGSAQTSWRQMSTVVANTEPECILIPFYANGPDSIVYAARMETLGSELGKSLAKWFVTQ